jgi:hypothetical protein
MGYMEELEQALGENVEKFLSLPAIQPRVEPYSLSTLGIGAIFARNSLFMKQASLTRVCGLVTPSNNGISGGALLTLTRLCS